MDGSGVAHLTRPATFPLDRRNGLRRWLAWGGALARHRGEHPCGCEGFCEECHPGPWLAEQLMGIGDLLPVVAEKEAVAVRQLANRDAPSSDICR